MALRIGSQGALVTAWQQVMRRRFKSYALAADGGPLRADGYFGRDDADVQSEYQRRTRQVQNGIVSDADLVAFGLITPPRTLPVLFTVEGHLSSMWEGPCAAAAKPLEAEGVCRWQPVGYDNVALPFRSQTGIDELVRLLSDTSLLPPGTQWGMAIFSQGAIVGTRVFLEHVRPESGRLHWRLKDLAGVVAFGNPYREQDVIAPWVPDRPKRGTQGISNTRMTDTPAWWREHSRTGDLYAENPDSEVGQARTAIYQIVAESRWSGNESAMWERIIDLAQDPADGLMDIALAIAGGVRFLTNMSPHGGYDLRPCIDFMRERLTTGGVRGAV